MRPAIKTTDPKQHRRGGANPIIEERLEYVKKKLRQGWDFAEVAMEIGVKKIQLYRYCYYRGIYRNEKRDNFR